MAVLPKYVIHGTMLDNLAQILSTGKLEINPHHAKKFLDPEQFNPKQIFTQILFTDLPNQESQLPHWFMCGIILDKSILKDRQWYATGIGGFYERFEDAFHSKAKPKNHYTNKHNDNHDNHDNHNKIFAKNAKIGASRIPSLAGLKKYITSRMNFPQMGETQFIHSHEVLFGNDIPLAEYGICILVREWAFRNMITKVEQDKIKKLCASLGIKLVLYGGNQRSRYWTLGLNKMIDLIDEIDKNDKNVKT